MDVVRRNIEAMRGEIEIESEEGVGSNIKIRLPLTLAIIDGFLVKVSQQFYVIPLDMVVECLEQKRSEDTDDKLHSCLNLRGDVLPLLRLRSFFGEHELTELIENIVVVQSAGKQIGIVVDEILGEFQTVIKPLGKLYESFKEISGATILGNGEVAIILDVGALIEQTRNQVTFS